MGIRNYLIEGVSGAGKTEVCTELQRRGYQAFHGDRELVYRGDPETGLPTAPETGLPTAPSAITQALGPVVAFVKSILNWKSW